MEKSADAFRTISEVADDLDLPQHVLRFWEGRFPQIRPLKRAGGRRYYRPADVLLLRSIRQLLYDEGYTIKGVQRLLKDQATRAPRQLAAPALLLSAPEQAPIEPGFNRVPGDEADVDVWDTDVLDGKVLDGNVSDFVAGEPVHAAAHGTGALPQSLRVALHAFDGQTGTSLLSQEDRDALGQALSVIEECEQILRCSAALPLDAPFAVCSPAVAWL